MHTVPPVFLKFILNLPLIFELSSFVPEYLTHKLQIRAIFRLFNYQGLQHGDQLLIFSFVEQFFLS